MIVPLIETVDVLVRIYMRVCSWIAPVGVARTKFGFTMHCDARDFIQRRIRFFGIYEPNLTHYIESRVKPGDCFVDVGANVGYVTLVAAGLVGPQGHVLAIEASPDTYKALSENLQLNRSTNVRALNIAATELPCQVQIIKGEKRNSGSNSIRPVFGSSEYEVRGEPLSRIIGKRQHVNFIKIDVEGSEGPILADILEHLDEFENLESIAVELTSRSDVMLSKLIDAGFTCFALPNNYKIGYLLIREYLKQSNEEGFISKIPTTSYKADFTDYVFERAVRTDPDQRSATVLQPPVPVPVAAAVHV